MPALHGVGNVDGCDQDTVAVPPDGLSSGTEVNDPPDGLSKGTADNDKGEGRRPSILKFWPIKGPGVRAKLSIIRVKVSKGV